MFIIMESNTNQQEFINFIKHQLNFDITSYISNVKRDVLDIYTKNISKTVLRNISVLSQKYNKYQIQDNGSNTIAIIFPKSKFFNNDKNPVWSPKF
jgi:hypothetical protein